MDVSIFLVFPSAYSFFKIFSFLQISNIHKSKKINREFSSPTLTIINIFANLFHLTAISHNIHNPFQLPLSILKKIYRRTLSVRKKFDPGPVTD